MSKRAILFYCLLVFALSWTIQGFVISTYGNPENRLALPWLVIVMYTPALVTLGFAVFNRKARKYICWKPRWTLIPAIAVAVVVPILIAFATVATVEAYGWGRPEWFIFSPHNVVISGGPWLLGKGVQGWPKFVVNVLVTGGYFAALNALAAIGEELGWRGFLQGQLVERLGVTRGVVLLGLIWSAWHMPSLLAGYNYPEHPILGAFVLFPVQLVAGAFFLAWLTIQTGSFWAAAIAHGAVNSIEEGVTANLHMTAPHLYEDITRIAMTVIFGVLFWILLLRSAARQALMENGFNDDRNLASTGQPIVSGTSTST
jgi:membrane protease YdiL (CAAX protease family)